MTVTPQQIEAKLRAAIQVDHLVRIATSFEDPRHAN